MFATSRRVHLLFSIGLAAVSVLVVWFSARTTVTATDGVPVSSVAVSSPATPTQASLHNPTLDNHDWYEFNRRYQGSYLDGSWLPDDDNNASDDIPISIRQDWRLWFLDGTAIIETDPEQVFAHEIEGIQMRPYDWGKAHNQLAGLYQAIFNTTPCLVYEFQMYGQSRPEDPSDDRDAILKVGIDQVGWHPDSTIDPAVHGSFPSTTVWGPSHIYKFSYAPLTVTAEALATSITVFTYGDAPGGRFHRVLWDTGSLQDVTPELIQDPDNLPVPSGITNLNVTTGRTAVTVNWTTPNAALGQVLYRLLPSVGPTPNYTHTVYLPLVIGGSAGEWQATSLNKTPTANHSEVIANLQPGRTYEYIVLSRGTSGSQCVTWVSNEQNFPTFP